MVIEKITRYRVANKEFETSEKAYEHVDNLIAEHVRRICELGWRHKGLIDATEYVLGKRKVLAELLALHPYYEGEDDFKS